MHGHHLEISIFLNDGSHFMRRHILLGVDNYSVVSCYCFHDYVYVGRFGAAASSALCYRVRQLGARTNATRGGSRVLVILVLILIVSGRGSSGDSGKI